MRGEFRASVPPGDVRTAELRLGCVSGRVRGDEVGEESWGRALRGELGARARGEEVELRAPPNLSGEALRGEVGASAPWGDVATTSLWYGLAGGRGG